MPESIKKDVYNYLKSSYVAVLATSYMNLPHASTVYYVIDSKLNFYFITKMNTDKHLNLRDNKNMALVVGLGPKHISVQVRGHAVVLKDAKQRNKIINKFQELLREKKIGILPIKKIKRLQSKNEIINMDIVYKIIPQHLTFMNLDDPTFPDSISDNHHTIIPIPKI